MYKVSIPEISKADLMARYRRIKPIVEFDGVKHFLRKYTEEQITNTSYLYNAGEDKREPVDMNIYCPMLELDFECIHAYGYPGFFKPSIAEVLAQIPEMDVPFVDAFEIIEQPKTAADFSKNKIVFDNGFHISKVRLYTRRDNPKVHFSD